MLEATRFDRFAALVVLTAFGVTWPVLQLLGENAEFFLARRSPGQEIVGLALAATLLVPTIVGLVGSLPGRVGAWVGAVLICITLGSLAHLFLAAQSLPAFLAVTFALGVGAGVTWAFFRYHAVRQAGRYLLPAPLVLLAVFLLTMPVNAVLDEHDTSAGSPISAENPVPVVMLVFDEFPVASIIDAAGNLRADRYPNFARLASDGIWYPNAVTVQQQTEHSVPAMLTGRVPEQSQIPVAGQHPFNLFTALRSTHDLHVQEAITQLCPRQLCQSLPDPATSLIHDVGVVSGHVLLPEPLSDDLPPIDQGWGDFRGATGDFDAVGEFLERLEGGRREPIDATISDIRSGPGDRPPLHYLHALIPHHPWQYLPDGRTYPLVVQANPASVDGGWNDDEFLVAQAMQRHLLQVGYADHVLGEVMTALKDTGIYDRSLMIVVADHGIAIRPGVPHQRVITQTTVGEIAAIPLFVKLPGSAGGEIDRRRALTTDILPTIADVLGADLPPETQGASLMAAPPEREETTTVGPESSVIYDTDGDEKLEVAQRIEQWFPGGDPWALRPEGTADLVGEQVDVGTQAVSAISGRLRRPELYESVEVAGPVVPSRIGATLEGEADGDEVIAVAVNGEIAAITRSYSFEGEVALLAMVEPDLLRAGSNRIDLMEVTPDGGLRVIAPPG